MDKLAKAAHPITTDMVKGQGDNTQMVLARGFAPGLVRKPHIDGIMNSAYIIIQQELDRLLGKSQREGLSATEVGMMEKYVNSLKKLASEEREQRSADRLEDMSDEEIRKALFGEKDNDDGEG